MITLTKFNGKLFVLNSDLIETIEETPDTMIKLTNGKKVLVKENIEDVVEKIIDFRRMIHK